MQETYQSSVLKAKNLSKFSSWIEETSCIIEHYGPVWYVCLKTENCCLKIFVEIRVGEKVRWNV